MSSIRINPSDYIGLTFGKLTVIGVSERKPNEKRYYLDCQCECGNIARLLPYQIRKQQVMSCGCLKIQAAENARSHIKNHNENNRSKHLLYRIWYQMIRRCENPKTNHYDRYGGRGISVCEEWHNFETFLNWSISSGWQPKGYSLDRINNDGNYEPSNCRWATRLQQGSNKSSNVIIEYNGQSKSMIEWSIETGIRWSALNHRINRGWDVERALTTPMSKDKKVCFGRKISKYDLYGNKIYTYNSDDIVPCDCSKYYIIRCCDGKSKTYRNYIWKYEGE